MRKPVVQIIGTSGTDLLPGWGSAVMAVRFTDCEGGEADELEIDFSVAPPLQAPPAKGTKYRLLYGWDASALKDAGLFTFQNASLNFDPESGWVMTVTCRSADFVDADKAADMEHFEETTAGDIFRKLATGVGKRATVHPSIDDIAIPYRLRHQQSAMGFAQAFADELGATVKPANGRWLITMKNSGETAGGTTIPTLTISADDVTSCGLSTEGRPEYGEVQASYFDEDRGFSRLEAARGLGQDARFLALHPAPSPGEAKQRSKAEALDLARATIDGNITVEGDEQAMAGAPIELIGFGGWAGLNMVAQTITHEFTFDESGGWLMTPEFAARTKTG
ncbi:phage late control D family protein [Shinella zoogloeoides]|uniref:Late control protein n=1 Tax=Shinella zoogloeoides TaxID=352475 RepID=A0A6N8TBC0_SHIZO|nr:contractile injection system protein, VgrG/Pvc8 family [Shinella zoogloeoides]MXN99455.1 hypothetical protein [Shinella zoogloeoides]UEX82766.1 hypothetical protein K8M09_05670 [Shinella zoogloeoides]